MLALCLHLDRPRSDGVDAQSEEGGNALGMMLYGMAQLFGKGVRKDETEGVRMLRRAPAASSTRAISSSPKFLLQGGLRRGRRS
jgi:hypothetical protein